MYFNYKLQQTQHYTVPLISQSWYIWGLYSGVTGVWCNVNWVTGSGSQWCSFTSQKSGIPKCKKFECLMFLHIWLECGSLSVIRRVTLRLCLWVCLCMCVCVYIHIYVYMNRFGISYRLVYCFSNFSCHSSIAAFSFHFYVAWHSFLFRLPLSSGPTYISVLIDSVSVKFTRLLFTEQRSYCCTYRLREQILHDTFSDVSSF
jgi:hypothetical protein